jgi:hypothetical protein
MEFGEPALGLAGRRMLGSEDAARLGRGLLVMPLG